MFPLDPEAWRDLTWHGSEVVRVVDHRPHLLVRITVSGGFFPQRALVPVMRIVSGDETVLDSWFTEIGPDTLSLLGYFPTHLPDEGVIECGYPDQPLQRVPARFEATSITRLDRRRLGDDVVEASADYVRGKRGY